MKGGIGTRVAEAAGTDRGAIVAVNAVGDIIDPATGKLVAGVRTADGKRLADTRDADRLRGGPPASVRGRHENDDDRRRSPPTRADEGAGARRSRRWRTTGFARAI